MSAAGEHGRYVTTTAIKTAVDGRETKILDELNIDWHRGDHIHCPYERHDDKDPSWRWNERTGRALCTCIEAAGEKAHSIFDVVATKRGIDFDAAKIWIAEALGRTDLIQTRRGGGSPGQRTDAESLLNPPPNNRAAGLPFIYLGARLDVPVDDVPPPSTATVGIASLAYFDAPPKGRRDAKPQLVGHFPCAVFAATAPDGRKHAHRIYLSPDGRGKADLGPRKNGTLRDAKKSASLVAGHPPTAGCCVVWGSPAGEQVILGEGIENSCGAAYAFRAEVERHEIAVMSGVTANGVAAFMPWPGTRRITVIGDRDEDKPGTPGFKAGEKAARRLAARLAVAGLDIEVLLALPGAPGEKIDWLDVFRAQGPAAVRAGVTGAVTIIPTDEELEAIRNEGGRKSALDRIIETFPIPALLRFRLRYQLTQTGEVWLHKFIKAEEDEETGEVSEIWLPICSPLSPIARLRLLDEEDAYGIRIAIDDMEGAARPVDFHRGELARMAASEIRARLLDGGLRVANGGEVTILEMLKEAKPGLCLDAASATGWPDEIHFMTLEGEEIA